MRYHIVLLCLTFASILLCVSSVSAQIKPSRTWLVDMARRPLPAGPMASMMGGVEMQRGWGSYEHEQAWQFRLHAVVEPYRLSYEADTGIRWTTSLEFHHELTANPMSSIGFNPRTARWEEQLLVHASGSWWSARGGWLHRCKHDIDNAQAPNEDSTLNYTPIQRTLILSGPTVAFLSAPITSGNSALRFAGGLEWYIVNADYRTPPSSIVGSWKGMQGALWLSGDATLTLSTSAHIGASYYVSVPWFSDRYSASGNTMIPIEARAEVFATLFSAAAAMDVVLSAEHTFDEVVFLTSTPTTVIQVGLRFRSK